jgi:hypothetical protein
MGRVALHSHACGLAGLRTGEETGSQHRARFGRHRHQGWARHGQPTFLPFPIPLDLLAG